MASLTSKWRKKIVTLVDHNIFMYTILTLILFNAVIVGIETYPGVYENNQMLFFTLDRILLWIFTVEIALRMLASNSIKHFFSNGWNWFDFLIVAASHIFVGGQFVTVLRILRVLRVFRTISIVPSLRRLVDALLMTIPALGNIMLLMSIIFYIFAVIGTMLFQNIAPEYFGNLQLSLLTLFQVVTLESWASQVMRPIFEQVWWSWIYFVGFVLVGTFVVFNLFIGVIVNNVEKAENEEKEKEAAAKEAETKDQILKLREEIGELKDMMREKN
ncbi:ion transporter [Alkalicoccus daliensis]|uniref:Voltage-gated sodium channel n=1 Tax=Alkalicoccus daliensis TaxID=745820 RepID=A0A1H0B1I9_9BACI|nr:voltage-gated sodium channel [Alkalicoccus daliensis]